MRTIQYGTVNTSFLEIKLAKIYTNTSTPKQANLNLDPVVPLKANSAFLKRVSGFGIWGLDA